MNEDFNIDDFSIKNDGWSTTSKRELNRVMKELDNREVDYHISQVIDASGDRGWNVVVFLKDVALYKRLNS